MLTLFFVKIYLQCSLAVTVVMSSLSIVVSIVATFLSTIAAIAYSQLTSELSTPTSVIGLEWVLVAASLLSFINAITLTVLASMALCSRNIIAVKCPIIAKDAICINFFFFLVSYLCMGQLWSTHVEFLQQPKMQKPSQYSYNAAGTHMPLKSRRTY